ncbi:lysophospholipase-like protein 1 [Ascaphus truei]|uniref:lysophospholipase-like protein 1 n=1 Tax=Ascaphus truei TaxID=8439 RepID=UPI003F5A8EF2
MAASSALSRCVVSPAGKHTASVIFLHGSGDTGPGIKSWIKESFKKDFEFKHIKIIFPTAPARNSLTSTLLMSSFGEKLATARKWPFSLAKTLRNAEQEPLKDGGFSMGGAMAMQLAYRYHKDVAGVFALSSFLNKSSAVYQELQETQSSLPELFQCHGGADELVLHSWGEETNLMLKSLGVTSSFHSFPNLYHELSKPELEKLRCWILNKLPDEKAGISERPGL